MPVPPPALRIVARREKGKRDEGDCGECERNEKDVTQQAAATRTSYGGSKSIDGKLRVRSARRNYAGVLLAGGGSCEFDALALSLLQYSKQAHEGYEPMMKDERTTKRKATITTTKNKPRDDVGRRRWNVRRSALWQRQRALRE